VYASNLILFGTVYLAFVCYVTRTCLAVASVGRSSLKGWGFQRALWTLGCLAMMAHIAEAFDSHHHWSHLEAYEATAATSAAKVGVKWGGGVYFNYAFASIWLADVVWWWRAPKAYIDRPVWTEVLVQGFFGFMWFNATVVFGSTPARGSGVLACLLVLLAWLVTSRSPSPKDPV
jgi:hypothetical protein